MYALKPFSAPAAMFSSALRDLPPAMLRPARTNASAALESLRLPRASFSAFSSSKNGLYSLFMRSMSFLDNASASAPSSAAVLALNSAAIPSLEGSAAAAAATGAGAGLMLALPESLPLAGADLTGFAASRAAMPASSPSNSSPVRRGL